MNGRPAFQRLLQSRSFGAGLFWLVIALCMCLSVTVLNRTPNAYFDTGLYLDRGHHTLELLGLAPAEPAAPAAAGSADAAATANGAPETEDNTTSGSRSAFYGVFLSVVHIYGDLWLVTLLQAGALILAGLITARIMVRRYQLALSPPALTALAIGAACLGSAPFYVAFLMPDLLAPIMILAFACLAGFGGEMRFWERFGLYALAVFAVLSHPSHLAMALLLTPVAILAALLFGTPRKWIAILTILAIPATGLLEHVSFRKAVETVTKSDVVYTPFMTARLIVDGPGLEYLRDKCPDETIATCALLPMLDEPERITPFNILFEPDPELGSLVLMPLDTQRQIMDEQVDFARDVLLSRPVGVFAAVARNTLDQLFRHSFETTLTGTIEVREIRVGAFDLPAYFDNNRLAPGQPWIAPLMNLQAALYVASCLLIAGLAFWPGSRLPSQLRCWSLILLVGIVANAFVCGAVSQPAARYGARVLFLLPMAALLLATVRLSLPALAPSRPSRGGPSFQRKTLRR